MQTFTHIIKDPMGLHARPAALLVKVASCYKSSIIIKTPAGSADGKRIMALMRLGAKQDAILTITIEGDDEIVATESLKSFLRQNL